VEPPQDRNQKVRTRPGTVMDSGPFTSNYQNRHVTLDDPELVEMDTEEEID
jgi:hypothetical protein